ncbi:hypothetical protein [Flavihumibacter profundi]|jgi:hypothetical protein|uniref:hypothetical protein n=1 Tax=Flavihumibacter profundi TaxID=2716883 RepID=UPI001CC48773|nr:hypothetical protein [Flavihumibacter profundi]MBZ5858088.1 hypothetical protein [Flavihumibacter profundi]
MTPDNPILAELQGISPALALAPRQLPYAVPVGYFESLPGLILNRVKFTDHPMEELTSLSPLLAGVSKKLPYRLPEGYFEQITDEINAGVSAIEQTKEVLETLHPVLEAARFSNPYRVPENYFEELPAILLEKIPQPGRLISISQRWFRFAVAASLAGCIAIAGWLYYGQSSTYNTVNGSLAVQLEQEISQLSDQAIFEFADSTQAIFYGSTANNEEEINASDMHIMLEEVSDDALQQYLSDQPGKPLQQTN